MRLVKVALAQLTARELADLADAAEPTEPQRAAALHALQAWRELRIGPPPLEEEEQVYLVLRERGRRI